MDIAGNGGELRMTVQITRAETGKTETVELIGHLTQEQAQALEKGTENGGHSLNSGA